MRMETHRTTWLAAFVLTIVFLAGSAHADGCTDEQDCRENFEAAVFTGVAVDSFAAKELKKYINPDDSSEVRQRGFGGFQIQYRLFGEPGQMKPPDSKPTPQASETSATKDKWNQQFWLYGRTIHGVRSTDVDCKATPDIAVCKDAFDPVNAPERNLYILRNATSLEAYLGVRWEFLSLQWGKPSSAALYFKAQAGFLTVANSGGDVVDNHVMGFGLMAVNGPHLGSRLEVGYGRTDLFTENANRRIKVDGLLISHATNRDDKLTRFRPFAQMTVDVDGGPGADSVQVYLGYAFDFEGLK